MRAPFLTAAIDPETIKNKARSPELRIRSIWERRYNQPSLGNPLFEDLNLFEHVAHISALIALEDEPEPPDDELRKITELTSRGLDPFSEIRAKLEQIDQESVLVSEDDDFNDIDFD